MAWLDEAWNAIWIRKDLSFLIFTKRPERIRNCLPSDWGDGWENDQIVISVENQADIVMENQLFSSCMTVTETYFHRNRSHTRALTIIQISKKILPR
jgi:hypothetical protein